MNQRRQKPTYTSEVDHLFEYSGKKRSLSESMKAMARVWHSLDQARGRGKQHEACQLSTKKLTRFRISPALPHKRDILSRTPQQPSNLLDVLVSGGTERSQRNCIRKMEKSQSSRECYHALQFESEDEDGSDAHTAPLVMMDITNMTSGSSMIQASSQEWHKPHLQPVKKSLLPLLKTCSGIQRLPYLRNMQSENNTCTPPHSNQENESLARTKKSLIKAAFEGSHSKSSQINSLTLKSTVDCFKSSNSQQVLNSTSKTMSELKDNNVQWHEKGSSKKVTFAEEQMPVRKGLRRKSASALCIRTPTHKNVGRNSKVKRASKLPISKRLQFIDRPVQETHSTHAKQTVSKPTETGASLNATLPRIIVTSPHEVRVIQNQDMKNNCSTCQVDKCDAAVNTKISFACGSSPDEQLIAKIENLNKEQEEITTKANLLLEQTRERRQQMKESGIMTRFATSISPLKRLQKLLQDIDHFVEERDSPTLRILDNSMDRNAFPYEASLNSDINCADDSSNAVGLMDPNLSVQECNVSYGIASDSFWNDLKRDNRFLQTPGRAKAHEFHQEMPMQTDEEMFSEENEPKSKSPVTELDGECERSSLVPMTPHTHQQVSKLKLNLKKQLELLYD